MTRVRYRWRPVRQAGSFTSIRQGQRRRTWLDPPIEPHVFEDACNDTWVGNGANHLQLVATMGAIAKVNRESPLQSSHPAHWRSVRSGPGLIVGCRLARYLGAGHDICPLAGIGREYPVVTNQMGFGARHQRCQSGDEVVRLEQHVRGAIAKRPLQLKHHQSVTINSQAFLCDETPAPSPEIAKLHIARHMKHPVFVSLLRNTKCRGLK
jgi:hypothetical protein